MTKSFARMRQPLEVSRLPKLENSTKARNATVLETLS